MANDALPVILRDAVGALERVAFLLERSQAPTYRVRAFRNAAGAVLEAGPQRVEQLWKARRLTDLRGVGDTTAGVISEALSGEVPGYLRRLEEEAGPLEEDAAALELLAALRGDCHAHSDWSDGGSPIEVMAATSRDLGHEWQALTDHSPRLTIARGLTRERLLEQLDVLAELNERMAPFRVLSGIEVDINEDGTLDQDPDLLDRLDVVVASVHSELRMEAVPMTARMVRAVRNPLVDVLGHCTGRIVVGRGRPPSKFDPEAVFSACAESSTAVEINCRPERQDPPDELLAIAVEKGCLFAIDTDAHAPGQLAWQVGGARRAVAAGIGEDRVVNAWEMGPLLAWSHQLKG